MIIKNTEQRFGLIAITIHWLMAVLIIGMLILGTYMVTLPIGIEKLKLYGWHKETGVLILALVSFRLFWRLINTNPHLSMPLLERIAARLAHWALYGLMFAMPMTGWLLSSAAGFSVSFFGLFTLPDLVAPNKALASILGDAHYWLGNALIALLILHTLAALKHHFYDKDDILRRMFP